MKRSWPTSNIKKRYVCFILLLDRAKGFPLTLIFRFISTIRKTRRKSHRYKKYAQCTKSGDDSSWTQKRTSSYHFIVPSGWGPSFFPLSLLPIIIFFLVPFQVLIIRRWTVIFVVGEKETLWGTINEFVLYIIGYQIKRSRTLCNFTE